MIIVDIETSGLLDPYNIGIWQIGALEFNDPSNIFLEEARIDDSDQIMEEALKVTGKTEQQLRDKTKQSQKQLLENFFKWAADIESKLFVAYNTPFDYGFLSIKAKKYNLRFPFSWRTLDLHVIAFDKYFQLNKEFPIQNGESILNLARVMELCGIKDTRIQLSGGEVVREGSPHNALEDAKLEAECLSRILYGKSLLKEFEHFPIPEKLKINKT